MARRVRVQYEGAVYHVMARGNERRDIFRDDHDRLRFLETLGEAVGQFGLRLHAYCLMPNHYHLLLGTPRGNLSRAMGWFQTTVTARFNARHRRRGHLFQGRFKAELVEADEYGRWLVEYIHLNPVRPRNRSGVIPSERRKQLERYRWSSHVDYAGRRGKSPAWLCLDWLAYWGSRRRDGQSEYRKAMGQWFGRAANDPWRQTRGGLVLGGEDLYQKVRSLMQRQGGLEAVRWMRREQEESAQARIRKLIETEDDVRVKVWARVRLGGERGTTVARERGYAHSSGVTQVMKRLETRAATNPILAKRLRQLRELSIVND
jgi:putative transposase